MSFKKGAAAVALTCLAWTLASAAPAPIPSKIAVLSLVGDSIEIDEYVGQTGTTSKEGILRQSVPVATPQLDLAALLSAQEALKKLNPLAEVATLAPPTAGSSADPAKLVVDGKVDAANPVIASLKKAGYGHLIVISKLRAPAQMKLIGASVGHGHITGLGFYIDQRHKVRKVSTGETSPGYMAAFAYLKLSLVDLETLAVSADQDIMREAKETDAGGETGLNVWEALTPERKTQMLRDAVTTGVARGIPPLMSAGAKR